jgi:2-polyprenyl-3-methyl-5-hydroxy-6-metoxy-1,4-benzoquinol methylase
MSIQSAASSPSPETPLPAMRPDAPPLKLATTKPFRFLAILDPVSDDWKSPLAPLIKSFTEHDPVAIVLRVESPTEERLKVALERITEFVGELGVSLENAADILVEGTLLSSELRGSVYTAAHAFVPCGGADSARFEQEARACGLPIVAGASPAQLRAMLASFGVAVPRSLLREVKLYEDPNRFARPAGLELGTTSRIHGYQEFELTNDTIEPLPIDGALACKRDLTLQFFQPSFMRGKSLLDIGANGGFFSFRAHQAQALRVTALDMDEKYVEMAEAAAARHDMHRLAVRRVKIQDWDQPADVVLAFAMVHWLYSCTATYGSVDAIVDKLASLTRQMLIIEWIHPADKAMTEFKHTDYNPLIARGPYSVEVFEDALSRHFCRIEILGQTSPTRTLYVAHRQPNEVSELPGLPLLAPLERVLAARTLCHHDGVEYHSRVYLGEQPGTVEKQTTGELAIHEAAVLSRFHDLHFPRVIGQRRAEGYGVAIFERIEGRHLHEVRAQIARTPQVFAGFVGECISILAALHAARVCHRDITRRNILIHRGSPVLIDFGWAETGDEPFITPEGLGMDGRPPDKSFCDVFSMGRLLEEAMPKHSLLFTPLIAAMIQPRREERVTNPMSLRAILEGLTLPTTWDVPLRFAIPHASH